MYNTIKGMYNTCQICFNKNKKIYSKDKNYNGIAHCKKCLRVCHTNCLNRYEIEHNENMFECNNCLNQDNNSFKRCSICLHSTGIMKYYLTKIYYSYIDEPIIYYYYYHPVCIAYSNQSIFSFDNINSFTYIKVNLDESKLKEQIKIECKSCKLIYGLKVKCEYCDNYHHPYCAANSIKMNLNQEYKKISCHHIEQNDNLKIIKSIEERFGTDFKCKNIYQNKCHINYNEIIKINSKILIEYFISEPEKLNDLNDRNDLLNMIYSHVILNHSTYYYANISDYYDWYHEIEMYSYPQLLKSYWKYNIYSVHLKGFQSYNEVITNKFSIEQIDILTVTYNKSIDVIDRDIKDANSNSRDFNYLKV